MTMFPLICPVRNSIALTRNAYETFVHQDVGKVSVLIIDNQSEDNTNPWLASLDEVYTIRNSPPKGVSESWNQGLGWWFSKGAEYVLVVNNDVALRLDTYRLLVGDGGGFVTAVGDQDPKCILTTTPPTSRRNHPDFSCYLIRRWVWEKVGPFDENFKVAFHEDNDMHLRLHKAGIEAYCINIPFYHVGSATVRQCGEEEQRHIQEAAGQNEVYFRKKWGFYSGTSEYEAAFEHSAGGIGCVVL